jgi:hypothetical protein
MLAMTAGHVIAVVVLTTMIGGCGSKQPEALDTSLCSIGSTPSALDGKQVRLRSRIESDGMHSSWLSDPSCAEVGIPVTWDAAEENKRLRDLIDVIYSKAEHPGTLDKEITASFVGVFHLTRSPRPSRKLDLLDVTDVVIQPRTDSPLQNYRKQTPMTRTRRSSTNRILAHESSASDHIVMRCDESRVGELSPGNANRTESETDRGEGHLLSVSAGSRDRRGVSVADPFGC